MRKDALFHILLVFLAILFVPVALDSGLKDRIAILWVLERNALYVWYT